MTPAEEVRLVSDSERATQEIGRAIGGALGGDTSGARIGLSGELGAGKTCLVRGIAAGLGLPAEVVRSPSFPVILPYPGGRLPLYHIDLFRQATDAGAVGDVEELREYLYGDGVAAVEWYERLAEPLTDYLAISITFVGSTRRSIVVRRHGVGYDRVFEALRGLVASDGKGVRKAAEP
jgi:tRNA threonylcarbamoyladenosine biosynthesis protein TsaE